MQDLTIQEFGKLLTGEIALQEISVDALLRLVQRYPYFESACKLYLKRLKLEDEALFAKALHEYAVQISMNEQFWEFLHESPIVKVEEAEEQEEEDSRLADQDASALEQAPQLTADTSIDEAPCVSSEPDDLPKSDDSIEDKEIVVVSPAKEEEPKEESVSADKSVESSPSALSDPKQYKRKIKDGYEHMGENLAATISSQMDMAVPEKDQQIQYTPERYFLDEDASAKEPLTLADVRKLSARPVKPAEGNGFIEIDEAEEVESIKPGSEPPVAESEDKELLDLEEKQGQRKGKTGIVDVFDLEDYANDTEEDDGNDLISKFIKANPRMERNEEDEEPKELPDYVEELAEKSVSEDMSVVSEPLIEVFIKQGYYEKAIQAFQQLSLNNPEKSAYFARRIKNLKEIIKKRKK